MHCLVPLPCFLSAIRKEVIIGGIMKKIFHSNVYAGNYSKRTKLKYSWHENFSNETYFF